MGQSESPQRAKITRTPDGYDVALASAGTNNVRHLTAATLADVDVLLIHHFDGHAREHPGCELCARLARGARRAKGDRTRTVDRSSKRALAERQAWWRAHGNTANQRAYLADYYERVTKPKREAARAARKRSAPLLMHRPRMAVRIVS